MQLKNSIKFFNDLLGKPKTYEKTWVIDDDEETAVKKVTKLWKVNYGNYPNEFFDHIFSMNYFAIMFPKVTSLADINTLARSPADYILFDQSNGYDFPINQWIGRTHLLEIIMDKKINEAPIPSFYSLKICAPGTTFYQLLCLITSLSQSLTTNEAEDRLFFKALKLGTNKKLFWKKIPIITIETDL